MIDRSVNLRKWENPLNPLIIRSCIEIFLKVYQQNYENHKQNFQKTKYLRTYSNHKIKCISTYILVMKNNGIKNKKHLYPENYNILEYYTIY